MTRPLAILLAVAAWAVTGCQKPSYLSTFPHPAATGMKAGTFITSDGIFESVGNPGFPGQEVDFRVITTLTGKSLETKLQYETRNAGDYQVTGGGESSEPTGNIGRDWFCFVEKPGTYWIFDGRNSLDFNEHGAFGSLGKAILQDGYVCRDNPKVPDALLARLPEKLRLLLIPASEKSPSY